MNDSQVKTGLKSSRSLTAEAWDGFLRWLDTAMIPPVSHTWHGKSAGENRGEKSHPASKA
ncbi:MAG: hypothetical protein ABIU09_01170 [Pyrinomonadaceae bacterium]